MAKYQGKHVTKRSRRVPLSVWLAYLLVATLIATGVTFSGYVTEAYGSDSARVAKFEVSESGHMFASVPTSSLYPGAVDDYDIKVENNSEVAIRYTITPINTTKNLPLDFYVVKQVGDQEVVIETGAILAPGEEDTYSLKIVWPVAHNSVEYSGQVDRIQLGLRAEQID